MAPALFHNGAFGTLEAAIEHHLDVKDSLLGYDPRDNNLPRDLSEGPFEGALAAGIDPLLRGPIRLSGQEFQDLVEFVRDGLFDQRVLGFCRHLAASMPSGLPLQLFQGCESAKSLRSSPPIPGWDDQTRPSARSRGLTKKSGAVRARSRSSPKSLPLRSAGEVVESS